MKILLLTAAAFLPQLLAAGEPGSIPSQPNGFPSGPPSSLEEPFNPANVPPQRQVRLDLLIVSVPEAKALELRADLQDPARIAGAQEKLLKLVKEKQAELVAWPTVTTQSGQRCNMQSILELRYPTEFTAPTKRVPAQGENPASTEEPIAPQAKPSPAVQTEQPMIGGVPVSFEKRDVGVSLDIEPTLAPDMETVTLQFTPERVQFLGYRKIQHEQKDGKVISVVEQPDFFSSRLTTNITLKSGQRVMIGFQKVPKPESRIEIMILQTTVETVGAVVPDKQKK